MSSEAPSTCGQHVHSIAGADVNGIEQARRYVSQCEPSVSGHGGHCQLFKVTCRLVVKCKLSVLESWTILAEFNARCKPPWSKAELVHKIVDAYKLVEVFYHEADLLVELPSENCTTIIASDKFVSPTAQFAPVRGSKPQRAGFGPGTESQLQLLATLRGIRLAGLRWARDRGVLVFGYFGGCPVFGVTDSTGAILEVRRLDGSMFPAVGHLAERKSHAVRGSSKRHPVGIHESRDFSHIIVTEGIPDFLAAHDLILRELGHAHVIPPCAPVALLTANVAIAEETLPIFNGKRVRIFYHDDANGAGWKGALRWQQQIVNAGALSCDFFHFNRISSIVKDLNDYLVALNKGLIPSKSAPLKGFCS